MSLFGGTLTVARLYQAQADMAATLNFDGGTLRVKNPTAYADTFFEGLNAVYVCGKGTCIDTNGLDTVVWQPLLHGGKAVDSGIDGGLIKKGSGRLTLGGRSTFNGRLKVEEGEVKLIADGTLASLSGFDVATGAILNLSSGSVPNSVGGLRGGGAIDLPASRGLTISSGGTIAPGDVESGALTVQGGSLILDDGVVLEIKFGGDKGRVVSDRIIVRGQRAPVLLEGSYRLKISSVGGVKPDGVAIRFGGCRSAYQ